MTGKVIKFEVPERVRHHYVEPDEMLVDMTVFDFDVRKTLGPMG